jgi:hypothetical protein
LLADHHPLRGINTEKLFTKPKFWIPCGWLILMNSCIFIFCIALMPIVTAVVSPLCYDLLFKTGYATTINLPPLNSSRVEVKLTDSLYFIYHNGSEGKYMCVGDQYLPVSSPPCFHLNYYQNICTPTDHPLCLAASTDKHSAAGASIFDELTNRTTYYILYEGSDTPYSEVLSGNRPLDSIWYDTLECPPFFDFTIALFLIAILIAVVSFIIGFIWQLRKNRLCCWREKDEHTGRNIPRSQSGSREHLHSQNSESNGQIGQVDSNEQTALLIESSSSGGDSHASIQPDSDDQAMVINSILPSIIIAPKDKSIPSLSLPALRQDVLPIAADKWDSFGVLLGVQPPVIHTVSTEHPTDFKAACEEILMRWLAYDDGTGDRPREWSTIIDALEKTGFGEEAEELKQKL